MKKTLILIIGFIMLIGLTSCDFLVGLDFGDSKVDFDNVKVDENFDYFADDSNVTQQDVVNLLNDMLGGKINYGFLEENKTGLYIADLGNFIFSINETGYVYDYLKNKLSLGKYVSLDAYTDDYIYSGAYFYDEGAYKEFSPLMSGTVCSTREVKSLYLLNGDKYNVFDNSYISNVLKDEDDISFETKENEYIIKTNKYKVLTDGRTKIEFFSNIDQELLMSYTFKVQELVETVKVNFNKFEFEKVSSYDDLTVSNFIVETKKQLEQEGKDYCKKFFEETATRNQTFTDYKIENPFGLVKVNIDGDDIWFEFTYACNMIDNVSKYSYNNGYQYSMNTDRVELTSWNDVATINEEYYVTTIELIATDNDVLNDLTDYIKNFEVYTKVEIKRDGTYNSLITLAGTVENETSSFDFSYISEEKGTYDRATNYNVLDFEKTAKITISNFTSTDVYNNVFSNEDTVTYDCQDEFSYSMANSIIHDYYYDYIRNKK